MLRTTALLLLLTQGVAFAGIHDSRHSDNYDSRVDRFGAGTDPDDPSFPWQLTCSSPRSSGES